MLVISLLALLKEKNAKLNVENGNLKVKAPAGVITPDIARQIKENKEELVSLLLRTEQQKLVTDILPVVRAEYHPASFAQQRLWFIDQLGGGSPEYNMPESMRFKGSLNVAALQKTLESIITRHEILRTNYLEVNGECMQVIRQSPEIDCPVIDLSQLTAGQQEIEIERLASEERFKPFDLSQDLMLRARLVVLSAHDFVFLYTIHHIAFDGWSSAILLREFGLLYDAFSRQEPDPLPALAVQYVDFAHWQRQTLTEELLAEQMSFWQKHLRGVPQLHNLPLDTPRSGQQSFVGNGFGEMLSRPLLDQLKQLAESQGATLFIVLQSAFALLLGRWSGEHDIVMGVPTAGRRKPVLENLLGLFVNTLVFRSDLSGDKTFQDLLQENLTQSLAIFNNQDVPFELLVDELNIKRSLAYNPLTQIKFVLQNYATHQDAAQRPDMDVLADSKKADFVRFDLDLSACETEQGLYLSWTFKRSLFDLATIQRLAQGYRLLLEQIVADPLQPLQSYALMGQAAAIELRRFSTGQTSVVGSQTLQELFQQQVQRTPDKVAVVSAAGQLTYRQLNEKSNRLARLLIEQGISPGERVSVLVDRSLEMMIALLGVLKANAVYIPSEAGHSGERLNYVLQDAGVQWVLLNSKDHEKVAISGADVLLLDQAGQDPLWLREYPGHDLTADEVIYSQQDGAYLIYTSGSTGRPKGVEILQSGLVDYCVNAFAHYYPAQLDGSLVVTSHAFDITVPSLYVPLLAGHTVYLSAPGEELDQLCTLLSHGNMHGVSQNLLLRMTPMHIKVLFEMLPEQMDGSGQKHVFVIGGEAFPPSLAKALQAKFPHAQIYNHYGPTEAVVGCAWYDVSANIERFDTSLPIGRPMLNTRLYVLNEALQLCPIGVAGELHIGGAGVAKGYNNQPELTAKKFITYPDTGERLYKSGDLVRYMADGNIEFLGRIDDQVKIRGFRIELGEIENILKSHAAIEDAVALVQAKSQDDQKLVAYIRPAKHVLEEFDGCSDSKQVEEWRQIFDDSYTGSNKTTFDNEQADIEADTIGWDCSYRQTIIPDIEMEEWVTETVRSITSLKPKKLLEIGAGAGLLLHRYANSCTQVYAIDLSSQAVSKLSSSVRHKGWQHVDIRQGDALNLSAYYDKQIDTIVLNSVAQYFPSPAYFYHALQEMLKCLSAEGQIFIGDIRNYDLLETFSLSVALYQAEAGDSAESIVQKGLLAKQYEEELVFGSSFFAQLHEHVSGIAPVDILVKEGKAKNELLRYRYDVVIRKTGHKRQAIKSWHKWRDRQQLEQLLQRGDHSFGINGYPNLRIQADIAAAVALKQGRVTDIAQLQSTIDFQRWDGATQLKVLASSFGYNLKLTWSQGEGEIDKLDLIFVAEHYGEEPLIQACAPYSAKHKHNSPHLHSVARVLLPEIKRQLKVLLPEYMQPDAYMLLESFPLTANGKVDKVGFPDFIPVLQQSYVAPVTHTEMVLQDIWQRLLNQPEISIESCFFEMGGHSLLVIRLLNEIKQSFSVALEVKTVFDNSSIQRLAAVIDNLNRVAKLPTGIAGIECKDAEEVEW